MSSLDEMGGNAYFRRLWDGSVYYTIHDDYVTIWAVMHLSRAPDYWKTRRKAK